MNQQEIAQYLEMVCDRTRSDAFERAIARAVPGRIVLDLGAGSGFLSHLALKHGAKKVYAIDGDAGALRLASALAQRFPQPERFVPIFGVSMDVDLPERVDVIVSETLDSTGIGEKVHIAIADAATRFLAAGGQVIPYRLDMYLALGESAQARSLGLEWEAAGRAHGLPYQGFNSLLGGMSFAVSCDQIVTGTPGATEPGWTPWQSVDLIRDDFHAHSVVPMRAVRTGPVDGIAIAWCAHLADDIVLSTFPDAPATHWKQGFLQMENRIVAEVGDQFVLEIAFDIYRSVPISCQWKLHHSRLADRERFIVGLPEAIRPFVDRDRVGFITSHGPE